MEQKVTGLVILDSTILIDITRENEKAINCLDTLREKNQEIFISIISSMELIIGCRNKKEIDKTLKFFKDFSIINISTPISRKAYKLIIQYSKSHGLVIPDAFIVATALENNLILITSNIRHFKMVDGLIVQNLINTCLNLFDASKLFTWLHIRRLHLS